MKSEEWSCRVVEEQRGSDYYLAAAADGGHEDEREGERGGEREEEREGERRGERETEILIFEKTLYLHI